MAAAPIQRETVKKAKLAGTEQKRKENMKKSLIIYYQNLTNLCFFTLEKKQTKLM